MKSYKINKYILLLLLVTFAFSCEEYLEESPDDRLELNSIEKAAKIVANSYSSGSYAFTDGLTDLVGPTGNPDANGISQNAGGNTIRQIDLQIYGWEDITEVGTDSPTFFWDRSYAGIAHANQVLKVLDQLEGDQKLKNAVRGEALLSRAYSHFMLVNMFGLHYDDNASSNLGVPYITEPETEFLPDYTRNTVAEVYDLVEKDLLEGLSLINDEIFSGTKKYHFTKKAAQAFASRYYLWKRDYTNCIKYSDLFLGGNPSQYIKSYDDFNIAGYTARADIYGDPNDESNLLLMRKASIFQRVTLGFQSNVPQIEELLKNPFDISDERRDQGNFWTFGTDAAKLVRPREYVERENPTSTVVFPYHIAIELKGEEVLLNRAEAQLELNNNTAALADINILAKERYYDREFDNMTSLMNFYNTTDEKSTLFELLMHERKKEFKGHGLRWFDIKRHNLSVTHTFPVSLGGSTITLSENDLRKAIQLPNDAIAFGLTPNPR